MVSGKNQIPLPLGALSQELDLPKLLIIIINSFGRSSSWDSAPKGRGIWNA